MKQNLMQKQLKLSQQKRASTHKTQDDSFTEHDLTSKAFFIAKQLLDSQYAFTKKSLANFLHGKPISQQQNNNQRPPSLLKGYMNLYDFEWTKKMIEVMIELNVLKEEKHLVKKKSSIRLFATNKYDWNLFPKVIIKIKSKPQSDQSIIRTNQANSELSKSRFTFFLKHKNTLPVNQEKRLHDMRLKAEKQKEQEQNRRRKQQDEQRLKEQQQKSEIKKVQKQEEERAKKEEQKKKYESQMNSFWMKQKQKIEQFVCPITDISLLQYPKIRKSAKQKQDLDSKPVIQTAGHVLQMQMKQLKDKQEQRNHPIKPIVSWSFMKNHIDESKNSSKSFQKSTKKDQINVESGARQGKHNCSQSYLKIQQADPLMDSFSQSTEVTQTNYKIKSINKKTKKPQQSHPQPNQQAISPFAQNSQQSIFSNNYYGQRRSTESIPPRNTQKQIQIHAEKNENQIDMFSFKKKSDSQHYEETVTIAKRPPPRTSSFEQFGKLIKKQQKLHEKEPFECEEFSRYRPSLQQTKTIARPKIKTQKDDSFQDTRQLSAWPQSPFKDIEMFSQTISMPAPIRKNQNTSTKDLKAFARTQPPPNRDSFTQQLIDSYMKKK